MGFQFRSKVLVISAMTQSCDSRSEWKMSQLEKIFQFRVNSEPMADRVSVFLQSIEILIVKASGIVEIF